MPLPGIAPIKKSGEAATSPLNPMKAKQKEPILGVTENLIPTVFHAIVTLSAPSRHFPLEGKAGDTRIPSSKKTARRPCEPIHSPTSSSRAQPRDLYCTAAICTHAPSLKRHLGASFFAFPSLTIYRSARRIPPLRSG